MVEIVDNGVQILALLLCTFVSRRAFLHTGKRAWAFLTLSYALFLLGDIYWLLYLVLIGYTPQFIFVSDISWYASYLFLYMVLDTISDAEEAENPEKKSIPIAWLGPAFAAGMCIFDIIVTGEVLGEVLLMLTMGLLLWKIIRGLGGEIRATDRMGKARKKLCLHILILCSLEYTMWTISMHWLGDTLLNPYYWLDTAITVCFVLLLPAVRKAMCDDPY